VSCVHKETAKYRLTSSTVGLPGMTLVTGVSLNVLSVQMQGISTHKNQLVYTCARHVTTSSASVSSCIMAQSITRARSAAVKASTVA